MSQADTSRPAQERSYPRRIAWAMEESAQAISLGRQLLSVAGMMILTAITHAHGLTAISRVLRLRDERLKEMNFQSKGIWVTAGMAPMLLALHTLEIGLFAVFYLAVDAIQTLEEALYYSASAYATLGRSADYFPESWRLIGAMEALIGFLMIGWSTAFIASKEKRLMPS